MLYRLSVINNMFFKLRRLVNRQLLEQRITSNRPLVTDRFTDSP
jgi:hypothetical protein